jgi:hypothetical protein
MKKFPVSAKAGLIASGRAGLCNTKAQEEAVSNDNEALKNFPES